MTFSNTINKIQMHKYMKIFNELHGQTSNEISVENESNERNQKKIDFYHNFAFLFERANKAKGYDGNAQEDLNTAIVRLIAQNSAEIMLNNKVFLYGFFFCIHYNNRKLAMILTTLLSKLEINDPELDYIQNLLDLYGIDAI